MQKAIYGLLRSALLFYKKLVANLESIGFKLNPYDPCEANKEVNGTQMMVCWHVDNLKVSHMDPKENTRFGDWFSVTYGMTVVAHQGAVHNNLGLIFNFSVKEKVMINMIEYIVHQKYHCQLCRGNRGHQDKSGCGSPFHSEGQILGKAAARRMSKDISSCLCPTPQSEC
jgi:hypothetical protein